MEKPLNRIVSSQNSLSELIQGEGSAESGVKAKQVKSSTSRSKPAETFHHDDLEKESTGERTKMKRPLADPLLPKGVKLLKTDQAPIEALSSKDNKQEIINPPEESEPQKLVEGSKEFAEMATMLQEHLWGPKRRSTEEFMKVAGPQIDAFFESPEADAKIERMRKDIAESRNRGFFPVPKKK